MSIRFLTDENISKSFARELRKKGYDVKDIKEEKLYGIEDKEIAVISKKEERVIPTHDKDFVNILEFPPSSHCGIVLIRYNDISPNNVITKFIPLLDTQLKNKLKNNLIIVVDNFIKVHKPKKD